MPWRPALQTVEGWNNPIWTRVATVSAIGAMAVVVAVSATGAKSACRR